MPVISLYADASYCPNTKAAGGAFVVKCGEMVIREKFMLTDMSDAWEAEVVTYGKALKSIMQHETLKKYLRKGSTLVAVLDCEGVGKFVKNDRLKSLKGRVYPKSTLSVRDVHTMVTVYTETKVIFEHVKAHTNADTVAAFYNSKVDEEAKSCMYHMRKLLKK